MSDSNFTPSMEEVLELAIQDAFLELHTCIPAIVQSYNPAKQTCSVQIALKKKYILNDTEELVDRPVIPDVPVLFPRGGAMSLTFPLKTGDNVHLLISERSTEKWKNSSGVVDPKDARKFSLSDAFVIPSSGRTSIAGAASDKMRLVHGAGEIEINENGEIIIKSTGNRVFVKNDQASAELKASGEIEIKGPIGKAILKANGDIELTNAIAMLKLMVSGMINLNNAGGGITVLPTGAVAITGPAGGMSVDAAGKIAIGTPDLLTSVSNLCAALIAATTPALAPAFSAATIAAIQAVKTSVDAIKQ